jgi:hypothetical protein
MHHLQQIRVDCSGIKNSFFVVFQETSAAKTNTNQNSINTPHLLLVSAVYGKFDNRQTTHLQGDAP